MGLDSGIPDPGPGVKKAPGLGSWIRNTAIQYLFSDFHDGFRNPDRSLHTVLLRESIQLFKS